MPASRRLTLELDAEERGLVLGDKFTAAVRSLASGGIDLVCFTGDVADWGLPSEYELAHERVAAILKVCDVPVTRFFAVPGNHDVQRPLHPDVWGQVRDWLSEAGDRRKLGKWLRGDAPPFGLGADVRERLLERTAQFWHWMRLLGREDLTPIPPKFLGYRHTIPLGDLDGIETAIHVVGLDSAWLCGANDDQGKIVITDEQVLAHTRVGTNPLDGMRIALVHHPLDHLSDHGQIRRLLSDGIDLLLHGHQHDPLAIDMNESGGTLRIIAAGCLIEGDRGKDWPNGFQLIEVDPSSLAARISFKRWEPQGRFWTSGTQLYELAVGGVLSLPPLLRPTGPKTTAREERPLSELVQEDATAHSPLRNAFGASWSSPVAMQADLAALEAARGMAPPRLLTAPPPMLLASSRRARAVSAVIALLERTRVVQLVGPPGAGKTQLARLVMNELGPAGAWLPLRDQHRDACVEALAHARENLARAPFIAVDDLPRVMSGTTLESELALLATAVAEASGTLLLLSHHRMPPSSGELFPSEIHDVPRLDSAEVAEYFEVVGAPAAVRTDQASGLVVQLTRGLPILVGAVARFLAARAWSLDKKTLTALFEGAHVADLRDQVVLRILDTVTPEARDLLYRLMLVGGSFGAETVDLVAAVAPSLARPGELLVALKDTWVEPVSATSFRTATLLDVVGGNPLPSNVQLAVHEALGDALFHKNAWNPSSVSRAFEHYKSAKVLAKAGTVLLIGLSAIVHDSDALHDYGLLDLWRNAIPSELDSAMRIQILSLQIGLGARLKQDTAASVAELRQALAAVGERDLWAAAAAGAFSGPNLVPYLPELAAELMTVAVRHWQRARDPFGKPLVWPGNFAIEALPLIATHWVAEPADVKAVLLVLLELDSGELDSALTYKHASLAVFSLTDRLVVTEQGKPPEARRWLDVRAALADVANAGKKIGWPMLEGRAVRADLLVLAEHLKSPSGARIAAEAKLGDASGPEMAFALREVIARTHLLEGNDREVESSLRELAGMVVEGFQFLLVFALVDAGLTIKDRVIAAALLGDAASRIEKVPDAEPANRIRILGELALAHHDSGDWLSCFRAANAAMKLVFEATDDSAPMLTSAVTLWHLATYLSLHTRDPAQIPEGFEIPRPGIMFPQSSKAAELYSKERRDNSLWIHAEHAEMCGEFEAAVGWRSRALDRVEKGTSADFFIALGRVGELVQRGELDEAITGVLRGRLDDGGRGIYSYVIPAMAILCASQGGDTWSLCADALERRIDTFRGSPLAATVEKCAAVFRLGASGPVRGATLQLAGKEDGVTWGVALLAESVHEDLDYVQALSYQLSAIIPLWGAFRTQAGVRVRLLQPFLRRFWESALRRSPFQFSDPGGLLREFAALDALHPRAREKRVFSLVLRSISRGGVDANIRTWLDET